MPGYSREIFDIKVKDKYLCSACRLVLREPFQTYCGHRYCKSCLDEIFRLPGMQMCKQCPRDAQSEDSLLKSDQAFPDRAIKRDIGELPAKCRNALCEWKGKTQHYDAHQETCGLGLIPCPKEGCGKRVMRMDLAAHLEKECAVRQVKCKYCAQEILLKEEKDHHAFICPHVPVNCEFCGKKKIPRAQMKQHLDENTGDCKRRKVSCTFAKAGCPSKLEREKLNDHIAKHHVDHLNHLLDKHLTLMEEFTVLKQSGQGQHLQQAVSKMDADMKALFDRIAAMENLASQQGVGSGSGSSEVTKMLENRLQQMASKLDEVSNMPGYPLEIFDIKVEDKYLCSACGLVLREPFQTYCGHRYCKSCLDEIFRLPGIQICKQCPQDAQSEDSLLKSDQLFPDRAIKRDIGELAVKCRNAEACEWKGKIQQYDAHQEICPLGLIPCPKQGCGKQVMRMDLAAHLEKECAVRQVKCKYCAQEILLKEEKVHRGSCSLAPVRCEWCGKEDLNLAKLQKHQHPDKGDCPGMKIHCTFAPVGCMELVDRRHIEDHRQKFHVEHETMLVNKIQHQRQETESLTRNMEAVFTPLHTLQQKIQHIEGTLTQLTQPDAARASQNTTRLPSSFPTDVAEQLLSPQVQNDTHLAERQQVSLPATTADSKYPEEQQGNNPPETALTAASQATSGAPMQATNGAPGPMQETTDPVILHGRITELEKELAVLNNLVGVLRKDREMLSHALGRQA